MCDPLHVFTNIVSQRDGGLHYQGRHYRVHEYKVVYPWIPENEFSIYGLLAHVDFVSAEVGFAGDPTSLACDNI